MLGPSMFHKIAHNNVRPLLKSIMPPLVYNIHNTRSNDIYKNFPRVNEKYYNSFIPHLTRVWNSLDKAIRNEFDINVFKVNIKCTLFRGNKFTVTRWLPELSYYHISEESSECVQKEI